MGHDVRGARAAVFGASGFIGRRVARRLANAGAHVIVVARRAQSIPAELCSGDWRIVEADLSREATVRRVLDEEQPSIVFNLAGYGVDRAERDEQTALTINAELPGWIAQALPAPDAARWPGQQLVHVGSALEYGEIAGDLSEDSRPHPTTLYGRTKLAGTRAVQDVCASRRIRGITVRLFTVYGEGEHAGRLLPTLIDAREHGEPIPMSAGLQQRDFTYVEDVAEGLLRLGCSTKARPGEIVNLATGTLTAVRTFAITAARVLNIAPERLQFGALPTRAEEMQHDPVSVVRLRELSGWVPSTSIAEGVRRTIAMGRGI